MFGFSLKKKKTPPKGKHFQFLIVDSYDEVTLNKWYRLKHWEIPNFLRMESEWDKEWKIFSKEEPVVGVSHENRAINFLILGDQEDFKVFLRRDPLNRYDKNAIKVLGEATIDGERVVKELGFLSKDTASSLKNEKEIDARPYSVYLPYEDRNYGLRITILTRSKANKKKNGQ